MEWRPASFAPWLFDSARGASDRLIPRWLFLRALGLIYFSAFFSLIFQIRGLIGPQGILPANEYLEAVAHSIGTYARLWFAPTLLWFSSSSQMLIALCWMGMLASLLLVVNVWPRGTLVICFICFLSFVSAAQEFSGYQSDGMLLEAGFLAFFLAPPGFRPVLGGGAPPIRASLFLLQWEWFRIYFESGIAKIASGDPEWRHMTAMDEYYQNGPLPTWIGWYVQHLPHWFHALTTYATLALELGLVWMLFLPRRWRLVCFLVVTPWELAVILTANYTFLNYLVLALGFLLLDDRWLLRSVPGRWKHYVMSCVLPPDAVPPRSSSDSESRDLAMRCDKAILSRMRIWLRLFRPQIAALRLSVTAVMLAWLFYATTAQSIWMVLPTTPLPTAPVAALEPFRIANRYGLFAVMTRGRYEIEFQGSQDGRTWMPYPFRFKPQEVTEPPKIYAPYQPRFDWNLWFASLGSWREDTIVANTEIRLLTNQPGVLALFAGNPFAQQPPREVRAVLWQYWFTSLEEKRTHGLWWRRQFLGLYAPTLQHEPDGRIDVIDWPAIAPRR
jgi:hypothetical protein